MSLAQILGFYASYLPGLVNYLGHRRTLPGQLRNALATLLV